MIRPGGPRLALFVTTILLLVAVSLAAVDRAEVLIDEASQIMSSARSRNDFLPAIEKLKQAVSISHANGEVMREGMCDLMLGRVHAIIGSYEDALVDDYRAQALLEPTGDPPALVMLYRDTGSDLLRLSRYDEAILHFKKSESLLLRSAEARRLGSVYSLGALYEDEGEVYVRTYRDALAAEAIEKGEKAYEADHDLKSAGRMAKWAGTVYERLGLYGKAEAMYSMAITFLKEVHDRPGLAAAYGGLGDLKEDTSRFQEALDDYHLSEKTLRGMSLDEDSRNTLADDYEGMAQVYDAFFRYADALDYYEKALQLYKAGGEMKSVGDVYNGMGNVYFDQAHFDKALYYYGKAREAYLSEKNTDPQDLARIYRVLGRTYTVYDVPGHDQKALDDLGMAAAIYKRNLNPSMLARTYAYEGTVYQLEQNFTKALEAYTHAETILRNARTGDTKEMSDLFQVAKAKALLYYETGRYHQAYLYGMKAVEQFDRFQKSAFSVGTETAAMEVEKKFGIIFDLTTAAALRAGDSKAAFSSFEEGKQRVFQAVLQRNVDVLREREKNKTVAALWEKRKEDLRAVASLELSIPRITDPAEKFSRLTEYSRRKNDLLDVEKRLNAASATFRRAFGRKKVSVSEIQKRLAAGTEVLEYAFIGGDLYVFLITRNSFRVVKLLDERGMETWRKKDPRGNDGIKALIASVTHWEEQGDLKRSFVDYKQRADALSRTLIGHGVLIKGIQRLLLVPDEELLFLPFEMLRTHGDFLVNRYAIAYLNSASDLLRRQDAPGYGFLGFGGMDYAAGGKKFDARIARLSGGVKVKVAMTRSVNRSGDSARGSLENRESSCDIPRASAWPDIKVGTREEVEEVHHILGGDPPVTGIDASKTLFMMEAPGKRYIHLATHGWISDCVLNARPTLAEDLSVSRRESDTFTADPLTHSFLLFAGALYGKTKGPDNGYLTPLEVMGLNLHGVQLVTLSACQTGLGEVGAHEGVLGMRRAFLMAGAQNLIVSEWEVPDRETKEMMVRFYRNIREGETIAAAFRDAQRYEMKKVKKRYGVPHPYFWSAFVHVGGY